MNECTVGGWIANDDGTEEERFPVFQVWLQSTSWLKRLTYLKTQDNLIFLTQY